MLVCGGRDFRFYKFIRLTLDKLLPRGDYTIIEGGAKGVDHVAFQWAIHRGYRGMTFYADWKKHGKAAGPIRNQQMIEQGKPDKVIAFPGGKGTEDMKRRARKAGIEVVEVKF